MAKIPVVFAYRNTGCGPEYAIKALERLGHETRAMWPDEYFASNPADYDLFWCQDSSDGIDFRRASPAHLRKSSMWLWDSASNFIQRAPQGIGDDDMAKVLTDSGGWVFHTWQTDMDRCNSRMGVTRQSWLPIAGDPYMWPDEPKEEKIHDAAIIGNCYDAGRGNVLNQRDAWGLYWPGPINCFFQDAAKVYRQSWTVFHVPTFFGTGNPAANGARVDLIQGTTMRMWEAMCAGVPIVTTRKCDLEQLGFRENFHYFVWEKVEDIPFAIASAKKTAQEGGLEYSKTLRQLVLNGNTYEQRLEQAFDVLQTNGVLQL